MIEWSRLAELRAEIGADDLADVAELFLEEADEVVARIAGGLPDDRLEADLHFLKGSALNLGLQALAALCQEGERKAAAGQGATVDTAQVAAIWRASRASLLGGLSSDQAGAA